MALLVVFWIVSCWPAVTVTLAGLKPESVYCKITAPVFGVLEAEAAGEFWADGLAAEALGEGLEAGATAFLRVAKKRAAMAIMIATMARVAIVERLMASNLSYNYSSV